MDWQIAFTLAAVLIALGLMLWEVASPDLVLMAALISLGLTGILTPRETFIGFSNPAVAMVGVLFMLSAALDRKRGCFYISSYEQFPEWGPGSAGGTPKFVAVLTRETADGAEQSAASGAFGAAMCSSTRAPTSRLMMKTFPSFEPTSFAIRASYHFD